jgi:hypothetical protein
MRSTVELDINARQAQLAHLFADPRNNPRWMDDIERIEPVSGDLGQPGSVYRLVPRKGGRVFVATVLKRALPREVMLRLDAPRVSVLATDTFLKLSDNQTRLISEEVFTFKGVVRKMLGLLGRGPIKRAHRHHMESFKRFAER